MIDPAQVKWFKDVGSADIATVGGKNAALGELYSALRPQGVNVPNGFALTVAVYRDALTAARAWPELERLMQAAQGAAVSTLTEIAAKARTIVYDATGGTGIRALAAENYRLLEA